MNNKKITTTFLFIALVFTVFGQKASYKKLIQEGNYLQIEEEYGQALEVYKQAYAIDSSSANINYNLGFCYLKSQSQKKKAERYLAKAVTNVTKNYGDDIFEKKAPVMAYFYFGQSKHINYKFDEAVEQYTKYQSFLKSSDKKERAEVDRYIQISKNAKEFVAAPINVVVTNLGAKVNSEYPEFSPVISADERTLIYTARRKTSTGGEKAPDGMYFEDILISYRNDDSSWTEPSGIGPFINTFGHEGSVGLTPDGQRLLLYRDDNGDGNLYYSDWDGKDWSTPQKFGSNINTEYWETSAGLSSDGTTLFFVSDRKGGYGGRDIYFCKKLPNGNWGLAQNLGPTINTPYDEEAPYLHPDGVSLFFASRGHKNMGNFDVYFSILGDDGKFSDPINSGYPINTPDDDVFYVTSPDGKRGYYSSSTDAGEKGYGEKDIFMISIPEVKEKCLVLFKGKIVPAEGDSMPEDILIYVNNKQTGDLVGTYRPKSASGTFTMILPPKTDCEFQYTSKGTEFYKEDVYISEDQCYQEIEKEILIDKVTVVGAKPKVRAPVSSFKMNALIYNKKNNKPVSDAYVVFKNLNDTTKKDTIISDIAGKSNLLVAPCQKYLVTTFKDGYTTNVDTILTSCNKRAKEDLVKIGLSRDAALANGAEMIMVKVVDKKSKAPIEDAVLTFKNKDLGTETSELSDVDGVTYYVFKSRNPMNVNVSKEGYKSNSKDVNLKSVKAGQMITISLEKDASVSSDIVTGVKENPPVKGPTEDFVSADAYKCFFAYNKKEIDLGDATFNEFVNKLSDDLKSGKAVTIKINGSASTVPTRTFGTNEKLCKSRANDGKEKLVQALKAKGADVSKLKFAKIDGKVNGPAYKGDYDINKEEYQKFQFVEINRN
jgi:tetratricopeptide (TPR) repeat protein